MLPARPLVLTADDVLLDELVRLAAIAGVEVTVVAEPSAARPVWTDAPLVVVGGDVVERVGLAGLPRRERVVVVGRDRDDDAIWRHAVAVAASEVGFVPAAEEWLVELFADAADRMRGGRRSGWLVGVVGGRGGAGASTLACALAVTGTRTGRRTLLVDGDPLGGGIDLALGSEDSGGLRWPDLAGASGRINGSALYDALPRVEELTVLSWDRGDTLTIPAAAMGALLDAGARVSDLVVVDLPRHVDAATAVALDRLDVVLLVVPAEVRATAAAARVATGLALHCADVRVVVRGPAPAGLTGDGIAQALGLPLADQLRPEPGLAQALELGEPPARRRRGPLSTFCERFLGDVERLRRVA